nr:uncharacterized protein LOC121124779 [Lepeophtheirus salmonis]
MMRGFIRLLHPFLLFLVSPQSSEGSSDNPWACDATTTKVFPLKPTIPWNPDEYYIPLTKKMSDVKIECDFQLSKKDVNVTAKDEIRVDWFYYPEYIDLNDIRKHEENGGARYSGIPRPCRFPVTNQKVSTMDGIRLCPELLTRAITITVHPNLNERHYARHVKKQAKIYSILIWETPTLTHTGTYRCQWKWLPPTGTVIKDGGAEDLTSCKDRKNGSILILPHHSTSRSASIYIKMFVFQKYTKDIMFTCIATTGLLMTLIILWYIDASIKGFCTEYRRFLLKDR